MQEIIREHIQEAIHSLQSDGTWPVFDMPAIEVAPPKEEGRGDYATNIAMVLARLVGRSPMEIAGLIASRLQGFVAENSDIEKVEVAAPGYINFTLSKEYFWKSIKHIDQGSAAFGTAEPKTERVMVEYSQLNSHKEFHIGHLRNVFIGNALVKVMGKAGYQVMGVNYCGDTGTHVAKCLWGLVTLYAGQNLDAIENKAEFLGRVYSEASQKIAEDPSFEDQFKALQKRFDAGDPELVALWEKTKQWSLDEFDRIYGELGVSFDTFFYESIEEQAGRKLLPELLEKGIVKESDGAIIADLNDDKLGILVLVRRDGGVLYGLKDIPLAKEKFERYDIDRSIVVVDVRQSLYFKQIFRILELYGFHKEMAHIGYEFVALAGGETMSSRKGNVMTARSLIDQVTARVREKFPESPEPGAIAIGGIRFAMLKHSAASKIEFDIDESVKLDGATGPYVQYAHARIAGILRKATESGIVMDASDLADGVRVMHEKEITLVRELEKFPSLVTEIAEDYQVHKLPHYAIRLAERFHSFYAECKVIDPEQPELSRSRLALVRATQIVLAEALRLIGVSAPERM